LKLPPRRWSTCPEGAQGGDGRAATRSRAARTVTLNLNLAKAGTVTLACRSSPHRLQSTRRSPRAHSRNGGSRPARFGIITGQAGATQLVPWPRTVTMWLRPRGSISILRGAAYVHVRVLVRPRSRPPRQVDEMLLVAPRSACAAAPGSIRTPSAGAVTVPPRDGGPLHGPRPFRTGPELKRRLGHVVEYRRGGGRTARIPGDQLARGERLGHVVRRRRVPARPTLEILAVLGGSMHHRHAGLLRRGTAQPRGPGKPVQHQVEQDQSAPVSGEGLEARPGRRADRDLEALLRSRYEMASLKRVPRPQLPARVHLLSW